LEVLNSLFQEAEHAHINLFCVMVIGRRVLAVQRFRDSGEVRVVVGFELYYSPRMGKSEFASLKVNTLEPSRWRRNEIRRVPLTQFNPCRSLLRYDAATPALVRSRNLVEFKTSFH